MRLNVSRYDARFSPSQGHLLEMEHEVLLYLKGKGEKYEDVSRIRLIIENEDVSRIRLIIENWWNFKISFEITGVIH